VRGALACEVTPVRIVLLLGATVAAAGCRRAPLLTCGAFTCDPRASYCEIIKTDVPRLPSDYRCKPLPDACRAAGAARTCDCFPAGTRCGFCSVVETEGGPAFRRTCVGGA
jgi:hypothetical protein